MSALVLHLANNTHDWEGRFFLEIFKNSWIQRPAATEHHFIQEVCVLLHWKIQCYPMQEEKKRCT